MTLGQPQSPTFGGARDLLFLSRWQPRGLPSYFTQYL
jgi:hypothetical protein